MMKLLSASAVLKFHLVVVTRTDYPQSSKEVSNLL